MTGVSAVGGLQGCLQGDTASNTISRKGNDTRSCRSAKQEMGIRSTGKETDPQWQEALSDCRPAVTTKAQSPW